jgi:serine/threonine-protein kinase
MVIVMRTIVFGMLLAALAVTSADAQRRGQPERYGIGSIVPPDWKLQPPDANWRGKRFVSPDGGSWLALYNAPADVSNAEHMKWVASAPGERITYQRRGRGWIVVSGFKGDRIFYRKAMLACGNKSWHHIAFEYPAGDKRAFDRLVTRTSHSLKLHESDGCPTTAQR